MTYASDQLVDEVAYVAYYFHWPLDSILRMEHAKRHSFIDAIGSINREINGDGIGSRPALLGLPGMG